MGEAVTWTEPLPLLSRATTQPGPSDPSSDPSLGLLGCDAGLQVGVLGGYGAAGTLQGHMGLGPWLWLLTSSGTSWLLLFFGAFLTALPVGGGGGSGGGRLALL